MSFSIKIAVFNTDNGQEEETIQVVEDLEDVFMEDLYDDVMDLAAAVA